MGFPTIELEVFEFSIYPMVMTMNVPTILLVSVCHLPTQGSGKYIQVYPWIVRGSWFPLLFSF